jgi:hypothetical protein
MILKLLTLSIFLLPGESKKHPKFLNHHHAMGERGAFFSRTGSKVEVDPEPVMYKNKITNSLRFMIF